MWHSYRLLVPPRYQVYFVDLQQLYVYHFKIRWAYVWHLLAGYQAYLLLASVGSHMVLLVTMWATWIFVALPGASEAQWLPMGIHLRHMMLLQAIVPSQQQHNVYPLEIRWPTWISGIPHVGSWKFCRSVCTIGIPSFQALPYCIPSNHLCHLDIECNSWTFCSVPYD